MTTKTFYKVLNSKLPNIKFKYHENNESRPFITGYMKNNTNNIGFNCLVFIGADKLLEVALKIGTMDLTHYNFYLVNEFNRVNPYRYHAILDYDEITKDGILSIFIHIDGNDNEELVTNFMYHINKLFIKNKDKSFKRLMKEIKSQKYSPIEEMN